MPWLMKTEPEVYGLADLERDGVGRWDGVRNYQARNHMKNCNVGDLVLIYHSGKRPAVVGVAEVATEAYPDPAQYQPESPFFDPKSTEKNPRWVALDLRFVRKLERPVGLDKIKADPDLQTLEMLRQTRLSVSFVTDAEFKRILELA